MTRLKSWLAALSFAAVGTYIGCGGGDGGTNDDSDASAPGASTDDLELVFPRMYSGYDGVHEYRIPVKALGFKDALFSASDPSMVSIAKEGDGAMITTRKAGEVTIIADRRGLRGTAKLTITGIVLSGIRHNPTQIGGWTDDEVTNVFTQGKKPANYVEHGVIRLEEWSAFHKWEVSETERVGVVAYLRSLEPREVGSPKDYGGTGYIGDSGTPPQELDAGIAPAAPEVPEVPACDGGARR